ncbi:hypothetical protein [Marinicellulosiphila megalodicopiae]|uniref:DUF7931 domain-containing protein n=1 Tax=Marinicellulosiphila megalodicopiae TaxID=2724896 RepID=UPI003BAFE54A
MTKFENPKEMIDALEQVFLNARRNVHVYVRRIDNSIWSDDKVISAIKTFIRSYKHAQLEVIQFDSQFSKSSEFFKLAKRLSQIQILQVSDEILRIEPERNYLYADTQIVLIQHNKDHATGFYSNDDRAQNQTIQDSYKHLRVMAKPSIEFKTLMV